MRTSRALLALVLAACACQREQRRFSELPPFSGMSGGPQLSSNKPGHPGPDVPTFASGAPNASLGALYDGNAWAIAQGKQLYTWFNCIGCHFNGGGGIGPPLMDESWFYGASPQDIFDSITNGRPEGMPSFRGKIPDQQVWMLVAYVRSMSGLTRLDVRPGRSDHMSATRPETLADTETPQKVPHP